MNRRTGKRQHRRIKGQLRWHVTQLIWYLDLSELALLALVVQGRVDRGLEL